MPRWLEQLLEREATARNWVVRGDGTSIQVSIIEVNNRFHAGFWAPLGESTVVLLARIDDADGSVRYGRLIEVVKVEANVPAWPYKAGQLVSAALADAVAELLDDPRLHQCLGEGPHGSAQSL